jgi:flavin reductase (DIM6/NTAB) family NADH-FMN oxidoreductase RutF
MPIGSGKLPLPLDKASWRPSILPGQIVVVSTVNVQGEPNLAPKSWITMAALAGPVIAFGCNVQHATYRNIVATSAFVVNVPAEPSAERIWLLIRFHGTERLWHSGFTFQPAQKVRPPIVAECCAHLECELESVKMYGDEVVIFGTIVAASIDAACQTGDPANQYFALRPIFFLEDNTYGSIDTAKRIDRLCPAEHHCFVVQIAAPDDFDAHAALRQEHAQFLRDLRATGRLLMAGTFTDDAGAGEIANDDAPSNGNELYLVGALSFDEAVALAARDPLVRAGARYTVQAWTRTF